RHRPVPNQKCRKRNSEQRDTSQGQVAVPPVVMMNDGLRYERNHDRSRAAPGQNNGERKPAVLLKPSQNGPRVGKLRGAVAHDSENEVSQIEASDVRREQAERRIGCRENQNAWKNDAPWRKAVEQCANAKRKN